MKVSREQAALNRERIVETAATLFRERGYDGIGVADLMKGAGLTHGGFYGHFSSKEDLLAEACAKALEQSVEKWRQRVANAPDAARQAIIDAYLTPRHCDNPGAGCAVTALAADVSRCGPAARDALAQGVREQLAILAPLEQGANDKEKRRQAIADYAAMVGAIVLARLFADAAQANEVLDAVRTTLHR
ncbi:TetR/AcrR family transcriptional regulator [Pseudoduganella ginsengisoli]|uniref:TetR family transcriptional regulator n=1 Tax=Pseudoduganella ginsengisoli TaxID=1462440 RepID=A0A6L6Q389_9BURK|nr:TetR/AcrR family transcriptional regulator [Pseudoduganella ginsengisoli]MTW03894.1 TetR family transcriptional regulator [Pseudoduganella ginsengisoli]